MKKFRKYRNLILVLLDAIVVAIAYFVTSFLLSSNENFINDMSKGITGNSIVVSIIAFLTIYMSLDLYKNITRYENGTDYLKYVAAGALSTTLVGIIKLMFYRLPIVNFKQIIFAGILITMAHIVYRVCIRFLLNFGKVKVDTSGISKNLLIIGAGEATRDLIKTIRTSMRGVYNIVGLIDDNDAKRNYLISGYKVLGDRYDIQKICKEYRIDVIFFSIANVDNRDKRDILKICQETSAKIRVLPAAYDLVKGKNVMQNLRDVRVEDVLGRDPIELDNTKIKSIIQGKSILVTGGGGSIGSELCRQIVTYNPKRLVIFDIYENNLYDIQMELRNHGFDEKIEIVPIVGSVRDKNKLDYVFKTYEPYLVFHAAAHKHVPLMEVSPLEAIKNNVFGTYNVANCADKYKVKKFILISTDKAVNPTNIMGATKRLCEMIIQAKNKNSETDYAAVRFGNVLGSNGSVIPLFEKQIAEGGPVTVTHKEITRFFMTIPEAVSLVLQAMSYANGGEIFILDMGEPVKIYDLAVSLIKLMGLEPNVDIPIQITGLRPGEKLYEELLMSEEGLTKTKNKKIFISKIEDIEEYEINARLDILSDLVQDENVTPDKVKATMKDIVSTYHEPEEVNSKVNLEGKEEVNA